MIVAFDVDGTLINYADEPRQEVLDMFKKYQDEGHTMIIWSGGGRDYAAMWARRLGLRALVMPKCCRDVDVAVDDAMDSENWGKFKAGKIIKV